MSNNKIEIILWHLADRGILFRILLCFMLIVGVVMGAIFPFFTYIALNLQKEIVLKPVFVFSCIVAGIGVGLVNYFLARVFLGVSLNRLADMSKRMATGDLRM